MTQNQQGDTALMFGTDYVPGAPFDVMGQLESTLTLNLLQADQQGAIPSPGNYNGYVVNYTFTEVPRYAFLFTTSSLNEGQSMSLGENANYFVGEMNMIESNLSQTGGGGGGGGTDVTGGDNATGAGAGGGNATGGGNTS